MQVCPEANQVIIGPFGEIAAKGAVLRHHVKDELGIVANGRNLCSVANDLGHPRSS